MRIEGFAVLVLKAFDKGRFAFGYKVGKLIICELLLALVAEDGNATIDVAALGDFRIEEDAPGLAFGARDAFTVRNRYLHLQKFFGDLSGIDFDSFAERGCVHPARLDAGKGGFPLSGHFDIGNAFALYGMVHRQPFFSRDKVLLVTAHVVTGKQGFDNGRTGGGRADTDVFQAVPQFSFLQLLAATLHS